MRPAGLVQFLRLRSLPGGRGKHRKGHRRNVRYFEDLHFGPLFICFKCKQLWDKPTYETIKRVWY